MRKAMLNTKEAAAYLGLSPHTLDRWRWSGDGPTFHKLGTSAHSPVRYKLEELDAFIEQGAKASTSNHQGAAA